MPRGQVSIEYLFLALIMLAALTFSIAALSGIRNYAEEQKKQIELDSNAEKLFLEIESVCALGNGNSRIIKLDEENSVSWTESGFTISNSDSETKAAQKNTTCKVEGSGKGSVMIVNQGGKIKIK